MLGEAEWTQVVTLQHAGSVADQLSQLVVGNVKRIDDVTEYPTGIIECDTATGYTGQCCRQFVKIIGDPVLALRL